MRGPLEKLLEEKVEGEHAIFRHMSCPPHVAFLHRKNHNCPSKARLPFSIPENFSKGICY
jgi:hypothetical protein